MTKKVVPENGSAQVLWGDENSNNYTDAKLVVWSLKKSPKITDAYFIEQLYGEVKPRVMCNKEDPQLWSSLSCNRKKGIMYEHSCW